MYVLFFEVCYSLINMRQLTAGVKKTHHRQSPMYNSNYNVIWLKTKGGQNSSLCAKEGKNAVSIFCPHIFLCAWQFSISGFICVVGHSHFLFLFSTVLVFCFTNYCDLLWEKKLFQWSRKRLKFEAEDWEFSKILRLLEQSIRKGKSQYTVFP